jgi:hypothetical protein
LTKPNHKIKWFLNGKEIIPDERFNPKQIDDVKFKLELKNALLPDSGKIKCVIYNDKGEEVAHSECNLGVKGMLK